MNKTKLTPDERRQRAINHISRLIAADHTDYSCVGLPEAAGPVAANLHCKAPPEGVSAVSASAGTEHKCI